MVTITGLTAERMLQIESLSVVGGSVVGDNLMLSTFDGETIDAGNVRGPVGPTGPAGDTATVIATVQETLLNAGVSHVTVDDLPTSGIVIAHRTGAGSGPQVATVPEGTIEGAWACLAMGVHIIDLDYRRTKEGALVVMHDDTVDRTTRGSGLVSNHYASNLPPIDGGETVGDGWGTLIQVPTVNEFLNIFGGKSIITIEAKGGIPDVVPLANLIKQRGLVNSVFINTADVSVVSAIVAEGIMAHLWAWHDTTLITSGIAAGASLIEIPFNASGTIVTEAQAAVADDTKNLRWFVAGPISTRNEYNNITAGIMGHVTDSIGHTHRATGSQPLSTTIKPSLMAGKRGIGWRYSVIGAPDTKDLVTLFPGRGLSWNDVAGSTYAGIYVGEMSGTPFPTTYTLTMRFKPDATWNTSTSPTVRFRFASTIPDALGNDDDSNGYIVIANGKGRLRLYVAHATTLGGATTLLQDMNIEDTFTIGNEYVLSVNVTPTTVKANLTGTGISKSTAAIANTTFRGGNLYIWRPADTRPTTYITDFTRT